MKSFFVFVVCFLQSKIVEVEKVSTVVLVLVFFVSSDNCKLEWFNCLLPLQ